MQKISRNVIMDLLPVYLAGEASDETKSMIEQYALNDSEIAKFIETKSIHEDPITQKIDMPEDLDLKVLNRVRKTIKIQMGYVSIITTSILLIPLIAMQFTNEVNWSPFDFIVMGILLILTGTVYVIVSRLSDNNKYKLAVAIAILAGFLIVWVNLAVGIIGAEDNPANLLYLLIFVIIIIGAIQSKFKASGLSRTMFITACVQFSLPFLAMIFWYESVLESPGLSLTIIYNTIMSGLFFVSGIMFKNIDK